MPALPRVSVIVVNYNGGEKLARCLDSLQQTAPDAAIVVVDNASTDGSERFASARAPQVTLIRNEDNVGYAAALNQGTASTSGEIVVFSNMDTLFDEGWLAPLTSFLQTHPEAGAVNPLILLMDGERVNAAGQHVHVTGLGFNRGLGTAADQIALEPFQVTGIHGAVVAMRRDTLRHVGGLDASGFLYHEDVNLSWLLQLAGYRLFCVPSSRVRHDYFLSMYAEKFHLLERNRVAMLLSYLRPITRLALAPLLLLTECLAWGYAFQRRHGLAAAKWRSYRWVLRERASISARRRTAENLRAISDWQLLRRLRFLYEWSQFSVLARERGESRRRTIRHLPRHR